MKFIIRRCLIISVLLMIFFLLPAQTISYQVEKSGKLYIGTPFKIHVDIESALEDSIFAPQQDTLDVFIRVGEIEQTEEITDDKRTDHLTLTFQGFDTGEFTFPPLEFSVKKEKGETVSLSTKEFQVNIASVISDSSQVIKDISAPVKLTFTFWDYLLPILVIAILIVVVIVLKKYLKRKPQITEDIEPVDLRPGWQICLELLHILEKEDLISKGEFLEFYYRLSIILRKFIALQYNVKAVEMTTSEIRQTLQLEDHKEKYMILDILTYSDRVKFAKFNPTYKDSKEKYAWLETYLKGFKDASNKEEITNA